MHRIILKIAALGVAATCWVAALDLEAGDPSPTPRVSTTGELSLADRIAGRTFPSVFQAWSAAENVDDPSPLHTVARHDLVFHGPQFFGLRWNNRHIGLADGFSPESIKNAQAFRRKLLERNPRIVLLAEIRYRDAAKNYLPEGHSWWLRDAEGRTVSGWDEGGFLCLNFHDPGFRSQVVKQAKAAVDSGAVDGVMLDWWSDDASRLTLVKELRQAVGDGALIMANANDRTTPQTAPFLNGYFMECYKSQTTSDWKQIADTLAWAEEHLRPPRVNCLETWFHKSRNDLQLMRATTTLALTHSDGYCLFSDPNPLPKPDHLHNWYPFWNRSLGRPTAKGQKISDGTVRREFERGTAVYNPMGNKPVSITFPQPRISLVTGETTKVHQLGSPDGDIFLATKTSGRITLQPQPGAMQVTARVPGLDNQAFALGIPETIGCREAMLVNFPEAKIEWQGPDVNGVVSCSWGPGGRISYSLRLIPTEDYVDVEMTIRNHTEFLWHDVFAFNCLNPIQAPSFQDWKLERTYMSKQGKPFCMAQTTRVKGHMPTVGFYLPERSKAGEESVFVRGFAATSPDRTDGSWIVTLSEPAGTYMAATAMEAAFLFDNLDRCCLHAAPGFGDIGPGENSTTVSRFYLARGTLNDFLKRREADRTGLIARQKWARSAGSASDSRDIPGAFSVARRRAADETKPHGRMEEMSPDELEKVLKQAPIAFVPLGTFEHHGWHLPVCFDGIKAHALCERVAQRTGGTVLPTFFYGTGGGHVGYKWTLMLPEPQIAPLIETTLDHLARQGFRVVVLLTGHYPKEQVDMVHRLSQEAQQRHPRVKFIGLTEPEITSPQPGDAYGGDHAAKYETSIALALNPNWVHLDQLTAGHDPAQVTLPETPRSNASTHDPTHPLYAIHGQDPRTNASNELGEKLVVEIVSRLARQVEEALKSEVEQSRLSAAATRSGNEKNAELAKWDDAATHRSKTGPGGTDWDAPYRSFIQTDENATSKGFPTHAEAAKLILADAAKSPDNLRRHQGWALFIKHFSQAYRPESATADLKRLYEDLVAMEFGGTARKESLPFDGDAGLTIHRDVVYGKTHPEAQKLDAYLVKSRQPTPVVIEFHGGGWRRGSKSQLLYPGDLIRKILDAGVSVVAVDYRLSPEHAMPAQMDDAARAVQFVRSKAKEWNLDPKRIVAMGGSAGAHLSAWAALHDDLARPDSPDPVERHSTRLRGFVDLWGPMDLTRVRPTELAKAGMRGADFADAFTAAFACTAEAFEQDPKVRRRVREASPLFLVTRDDPPALIIHAAGEDMAPGKHPPVPEIVNDPHSAWHGALLAEAMREAGIEVVCRIGPQVGKDPAADNAAILDFLRRHLANPDNRP